MLLKTERFPAVRIYWDRVKGYAPLFFYTLLLFKGALMAPGEIPGFISRINDKFLHAVEYFFLFLFSVHAFSRSQTLRIREHCQGAAMAYALILGIMTEAAQFFFTAGRTAEIGDFFLDGVGAFAALFFLRAAMEIRLRIPMRQEAGTVI